MARANNAYGNRQGQRGYTGNIAVIGEGVGVHSQYSSAAIHEGGQAVFAAEFDLFPGEMPRP